MAPDVPRGHDVQQRDSKHAVRMVERHTMRGARPAVVSSHEEAIMAERSHHVNLILSHGTERVMDVFQTTIRGAYTVAITAQVGRYHVESLGQGSGDFVPGCVRERVAMEQEERWALTAVT